MNRLAKLALPVLAALITIFVAVTAAQNGGFAITSWTVDNGGGPSTGNGFTLNGTIGQPDAGQNVSASADQQFRLTTGFWQAAPQPGVCIPISSVAISGPLVQIVGEPVTLSVNISPAEASGPFTLVWSPEPIAGQGNLAAQYRWESVGNRTVTLQVTNCNLQAPLQAQHQINVTEITLTGIEITQGVQDLQGTVALVRDRPTFVRAHLSSASGHINAFTARLIGRRNGTVLSGSPLLPINLGAAIRVRPTPDRSRRDDSLLFALPQSWLNGTVDLQIVPGNFTLTCADGLGTPNDCAGQARFDAVSVPELRMVGIIWTDANGTVHDPEIYDFLAVAQDIRAQFPISNLNWDRRAEIVWSPEGTPDLNDLLSHLNTQRTLDGSSRMYYGLLIDHPGGGLGLGYVPGDASVGYYRVVDPTTASHELGHNFGRPHTNCTGTEDGPGPFPHANGRISTAQTGDAAIFGFHAYSQTIFGPNTGDLLGYCRPRWVSNFTYNELRTAINAKFTTTALNQTEPQIEIGQAVVMVSGVISPTLPGGSLETILVTTAQAATPVPLQGSYILRFEDAAGNTIADYRFDPYALSDSEEEHFAFLTPYHAAATRVVLLKDAQVLEVRQVSANAPTLNLIAPAAGTQWNGSTATIRWNGSDADGDSLEYTIQYSRDDGQQWETIAVGLTTTDYEISLNGLAGSTTARIRVLASDGFNTAVATSDRFTVALKVPVAVVLTPFDQQIFVRGQLVSFEAEAIDNEDGLLPESAFSWNSDLDGSLNNGRRIDIHTDQLSVGVHTITVVARDSDNQIGTATITVQIVESLPPDAERLQLFLPLIWE